MPYIKHDIVTKGVHRLFAEQNTSDKKKGVDNQPLSLFSVGITGLEPATSRPPDVCATNCAKSRTLLLKRVQR